MTHRICCTAVVGQFNARKFRSAFQACVWLENILCNENVKLLNAGQMFGAGKWSDPLKEGDKIVFYASLAAPDKIERINNVTVVSGVAGRSMTDFCAEVARMNEANNVPRDVVKLLNRIEHRLNTRFALADKPVTIEGVMNVVRKVLESSEATDNAVS